MDSLTQAKTDTAAYSLAVRNPQTWIMSVLYIGTFGSFIGYSFALPLVIKNTFPEFLAHHAFIATYLAGLGFMGALLGSLARPRRRLAVRPVRRGQGHAVRLRRDGVFTGDGDRRGQTPTASPCSSPPSW